jgi:hypothetical protein
MAGKFSIYKYVKLDGRPSTLLGCPGGLTVRTA